MSAATVHPAVRRVGTALVVLWAPVVLIGLAATLYVPAAAIGVPLLLVSVPPMLAGRRLRHGRPFRAWMIVIGFVGIAVVTATSAVFLGVQPLWTWFVAAAWIAAVLATGSEALQARHGVPPPP